MHLVNQKVRTVAYHANDRKSVAQALDCTLYCIRYTSTVI